MSIARVNVILIAFVVFGLACARFDAQGSAIGLLLTQDGNGAAAAAGDEPQENTTSENFRRVLRFQNGGVAETLTNFAVPVFLNASRIDYDLAGSAGGNVRFTDPDGTILEHEIEEWNGAGTSLVWVRVPAIDAVSNADFIYMYYGSDYTTAEDPGGLWIDYEGVWHLNESPDGTTGEIVDSTGNGHNGTTAGGMSAADSSAGLAGPALFFDGTDDRVEIPDAPAITFTSADSMTLQAIVQDPVFSGAWNGMVTKARDSFNFYGFWISPTPVWTVGLQAGGGNFFGGAASNSWVLLTYTQDVAAGEQRIYVDAARFDTRVGTGDKNGAGDLWIGGSKSVSEFFSGGVDEVRITGQARSDAHVAATHAALTDTYISFEAEEAAN